MTGPERITVFVYGTLMRGEPYHHLLGDALFEGQARTAAAYELVVVDWYPGLISGANIVHGELFSVAEDFLPQLDRYEGHPVHFTRSQIELSSGVFVTAYVFNPVSGGTYQKIPGGCGRGRTDPKP